MPKPRVALIDYGVGNMLNVARALEHIGARVDIIDGSDTAISADHLVLPGVGSFPDAMRELALRQLIAPLQSYAASGRPLLGICLGMQLLLDNSTEFEPTSGLGLIPGNVVRIPRQSSSGLPLKVPHIGWNRIVASNDGFAGTIFANLSANPDMYFVHSYMTVPHDVRHRLAEYDYAGERICAAVQKDNVIGCQFHPEKSGEQGLEILKLFVQT